VEYPRIIAHRCGGVLAAENSLAGLAAAARIGCHGVEFDAMLSADGVPVLMHDDTLDRTTNGRGPVGALTVAELRRVDLGGEPVPLLSEALERCAELGLWANIEIKTTAGCDEDRFGRVVGETLAKHWNGHGIVSSFSMRALLAIKSQAWEHGSALLVETLPEDWREQVRQVGAIAVHMDANCTTVESIAAIRDAGLAVVCYTVNDFAKAEWLLASGASAVFTDCPDLWSRFEM
jgi:glycerophosphoryl diester phosphodiesterase